MAIDYPVELDIHLRSIWHHTPPEINIGINNNIKNIILTEDQIFHYQFVADKSSILTVELLNKTDTDTVPELGLDKAVVIESISFFGIADPRFVWSGVYEPTYPEPWYSQQTIKPQSTLTSHTYLCWNGKWTLTFDIPVFTWIHQTQDLGWIYD